MKKKLAIMLLSVVISSGLCAADTAGTLSLEEGYFTPEEEVGAHQTIQEDIRGRYDALVNELSDINQIEFGNRNEKRLALIGWNDKAKALSSRLDQHRLTKKRKNLAAKIKNNKRQIKTLINPV